VLIVAATERELTYVRNRDTFVCGVGPVEAAVSVTRALAKRRPDAVLHVGIAGARAIEPLSLVLGSEAVYSDIEARIPVVDRVAPSAPLFDRIHAALPDAHVLPIGTSARVGGATGCEVEAMEGFAVLRACEEAGVPAVELRVVSNRYGETEWRFEEAFELLCAALERIEGGRDGMRPAT
jgi:predicted 5'-methylthioadenosine/S-adenosylhomocysteine nucleosidase